MTKALYLNDGNILVRPRPEEEVEEGILWHPSLLEKTLQGTVVISAVPDLITGDKVLFPSAAGQPMLINQQEYIFLDKEDVLAKLEKN